MARQLGRSNRTFLFYELGLIRSPYPVAALRELQSLNPHNLSDILARLESILAAKP